MKKLLSILLIFVLAIAVFFVYKMYFVKNQEVSQEITVDQTLPQDVHFIDSSESKRFSYEMNVKLDSIKDETGFHRVWYLLRISKKNQEVYNNIRVTGFFDESMRDIIMSQTFLGFGTDIDDKISLDKDSKGIEAGRATYISDSLGLDEIKDRLKKEIKVKVIWDSGEEYVVIPSHEINLEVIK